MNNLNSLILEGVVSGEPHKLETSDVINFTVEVTRYTKNRAGKDVEEKFKFKVVAYGRMCDTPLKDGSKLRIVGRLESYEWYDGDGVSHLGAKIVAEHIEMRA